MLAFPSHRRARHSATPRGHFTVHVNISRGRFQQRFSATGKFCSERARNKRFLEGEYFLKDFETRRSRRDLVDGECEKGKDAERRNEGNLASLGSVSFCRRLAVGGSA
jgi:hypothetical protein